MPPLPTPTVTACYFDIGFVPPLAAMELRWEGDASGEGDWTMPSGEHVRAGLPERFGLRYVTPEGTEAAPAAVASAVNDAVRPLGIVVNTKAERFYDEGEDFWPKRYAIWGRLIAQQPGQVAYSICDASAFELFMPSVYPAIRADSSEAVVLSTSGCSQVMRPVWASSPYIFVK